MYGDGDDSPSEIQKDQKLLQNMMIHIEGDEDDAHNPLKDDDEGDSDEVRDRQARKFIESLKQVGPFSKQILNYSYPPLLYQRGDDEGDDEDDDEEADGLPDIVPGYDDDEDEDRDIQELINGGGGSVLNNQDLYAKL